MKVPPSILAATFALTAILAPHLATAAPYPKVAYEDNFSAPALNKTWQLFKADAAVKDGALVMAETKDGNHAAVASILTPPTADMDLAVSFKFDGSDTFAVTLNDKGYKGSHAGHIARVRFTKTLVEIADEKTGRFKNEIYEMKTKDAATLELLKTKAKTFPVSLDQGTWYKLFIHIEGDTITVSINDKEVGRFSSEGFAHPEKNKPAIVVSKQFMQFDDFSVRLP